VIADNFGVLADAVFESKTSIPGISVIAGTTFFALQIYTDFSGYSDIAIGISRMLGFDLMTNFKTPYFAKSFNDFWSRWHISLSTWFRDYVYIPLGGNRKGNFRVSLNIFLTFLLSGLWHGANFTFLIWGGLHGLVLVLEKQIKMNISKFIYVPLVFITVILFWLPFRAENMNHLWELTRALIDLKTYSFSNILPILSDFSTQRFITLIAITTFFFVIEFNMKLKDFNQWIALKNKPTRIAFYYLLLVLILLVGNFSVKPSFIYFQF
jgi:D-alanyl-lipoteichoic acid acyltransferase DltB (MBOAT superfamily)